MSPARPAHETDTARPLRAERRTAGLVAQYIHEISDRHAIGSHADRRSARATDIRRSPASRS